MRGENLIDGQWRPAAGRTTQPNINPANRLDVIGDFAESDTTDIDAAVGAAAVAGLAWRDVGPIRRAELLDRPGQLLTERAAEFASAICREQGKRISEAQAEVDRALAILRFLAGEGRRLNGVTTPADDSRTIAYTTRVPIGPVALITPWNFPLAIPLWKVAAALVAGCPVVLKPSPLAPHTPAMLVEIFQAAGLPDGVLNLVQGGAAAGVALVAHPQVTGVSFTGSVPVGLAIQAAGAPRLLRTQLELGGNNAMVVLADADLDAAIKAGVFAAFGQAGQRCSATSRIIVESRIADRFRAQFVDAVAALRVGPPGDPSTEVGPLINQDAVERCTAVIADAVVRGARLWCGDEPLPAELAVGSYLRPCVLSDVPADSPLLCDEVFGPIVSLVEVEDFDAAVRAANSVPFGLSASVFTADIGRAVEATTQLDAGMVHVNRPGVGAFPHMPHGGTKLSQFGPPECAPQVWDFFTEWRSVCIRY